MLQTTAEKVKEAERGEFSIDDLNPDTNNDGRVDMWEAEVWSRILAADTDQSGTISVRELFAVIRDHAKSDRLKRIYRRSLVGTVVLLALLVLCITALTALVVAAFKDSWATAGALSDDAGRVIATAPAIVSLPLLIAP